MNRIINDAENVSLKQTRILNEDINLFCSIRRKEKFAALVSRVRKTLPEPQTHEDTKSAQAQAGDLLTGCSRSSGVLCYTLSALLVTFGLKHGQLHQPISSQEEPVTHSTP